MRRASGNQHAFACERAGLRRAQKAFGSGCYFHRLRHPADTGFAGFGHFTGIGADEGDPVAFELRDVAAGGGIVPHQRIHRRRQQDRPVGGQQNGAGEIVGMALRHLRHQIGGSGRHHDQIAFTGEPNMAGIELAFGVEQIGVGALVRQRAGGKLRDELLRGFCQHAADLDVPLLQPPNQVQCLVGGDAAADDERDARQASGRAAGGLSCWSLRFGLERRLWRAKGRFCEALAQDHPHLVLDRAAVTGGAETQFVADGIVEFSDGQAGHGGFRANI